MERTQRATAPQGSQGHQLSPLWAYIAVAALYLCGLAVVGSALAGRIGFPLDDSWIHQSIGRNLAWYGSLGYLPHQRSSGSTSLLWTVILSLNYSVLPRVSPVVFSAVFNSVCMVAVGAMLLRLALRDGLRSGLAVVLAAAPAADGNFVWLAFTGMEHVLFIALSVAGILLWQSARPGRPGTIGGAMAAAVCLGLLSLTRPEGVVLAVLLFAFYARFGRTLRQAAVAAGITGGVAVIPFVVNLITSHSLLPVTFKGRQWLYFGGNTPGLEYRAQLFEQWVTRPAKALTMFDGYFSGSLARALVFVGAVLILVFAALSLYALYRRRSTGLLVFAAWSLIHSLLYLLVLPVSGHAGRYQPFLLLLLLPIVAGGVYVSVSRGLNGRFPLAVSSLVVLGFAAFSLPLWRTVLRADVDHIESSHGAMAAWLAREDTPSPLAVFDIGRIGYSRDDDVVDLGGLSDVTYAGYLINGRVPEYLRQHSITRIVLPEEKSGYSFIAEELHLIRNPELTLSLVHRECTAEAVWKIAWIETRNATQCQALYTIKFR